MAGEWREANLSVILEGLDPVLEGVRFAARTADRVLSPVQSVVEKALAVVEAIDPNDFEIDVLLDLLVDVAIVHLYPRQAYQLLKRRAFLETMAYSFGAGQADVPVPVCTLPPYSVWVIAVAADNFDALQAAIETVGLLWGLAQALPGELKDTPLLLKRPLVQITPARCEKISEVWPWLGELLDLLSGHLKIGVKDTVAAIQVALLEKLLAITELLDDLDRALEILKLIDVPNLWIYEDHGLTDLDDLAASMTANIDGPRLGQYMAGTGLLTNTTGALILKPILSAA